MPSASLWAYSEENSSLICSSEKPAGFSELLFYRKGRNFQMLFFFAAPSVKNAIPDRPQSVRYCSNKNSISAKDAQSGAEGISNRQAFPFFPPFSFQSSHA